MAIAPHYGGYQSLGGFQGNSAAPGGRSITTEDFKGIKEKITSFKNQGMNLDKIFQLTSQQDKEYIFKLFDQLSEMVLKYSRGIEIDPNRFNLIYNSLQQSNFIGTGRDKNLSDLLDDDTL